MGTLIDDLLQFSRTGRQEMRQVAMDMNVLVEEALEELKPDIVNRNISLDRCGTAQSVWRSLHA